MRPAEATSHMENIGTGGNLMRDEAGSSDNRIAWNPNEFKETADWEDGTEYEVTAVIRQTAPGEAIVLQLTGKPVEPTGESRPSPETAEAEEAAPTGGDTYDKGAQGGYDNPAIARAMGQG